MGKERSIVLCIIFTIITCGIYGIYWMIVLNDDMLDALEEEGTSGGMVFLFSLITCGIYGLYWIYQMGKRVDRLNDRYGRHTDNSGLLYLLVSIIGLQIVVYAIMQNGANLISVIVISNTINALSG